MKTVFKNRLFQASLVTALAVVAYMAGLITPEAVMLGGLFPMAIGETDFGSLKDLLIKQGEAFEEFKKQQDSKVATLKSAFQKIETKLNRPGAIGDMGEFGENSPVGAIKTTKGVEGFLLQKGQKLSQHSGGYHLEDDAAFNLGDYARDAIVGSRKAMGSGPALVPLELSSTVIDMVREASVVAQAGASTLVLDSPTNLARIEGDPTVYQHTENTADIFESDVNMGFIPSNPKLLVAAVPLSEELVSDSPNLDAVLRTSISAAFSEKLDALVLAKLLADAGIPKSSVGQDPADWVKVLAAVGEAMAVKQGVPGILIGNPADFIARSSQRAAEAGWLGKPPALSMLTELSTVGIDAGTAFFGDFAKALMIAVRSEMRIEVVRWKSSSKAQHLLVAHARMDGYIVQPGAIFKQLKTV